MNNKNQYRVVIDEVTEEDIGVVVIDMDKWKGDHYIIDPDGDERKKYKYRVIDAAKYDTVIAFETHPIFEVNYKPIHHWLGDREDVLGMSFVVSLGTSILCAYVMSSVIMFSDLAPLLKNSIWYQLGYGILMISTIVGGVGLGLSVISNSLLKENKTKKDKRIEKWLEFLRASI
jgi:hypothetical protein